MKALIVDDEKNNRLLLSKILVVNGYEIIEASNGIEALKRIEESRPDIVISDIMMPEMDGFQLGRELKKNEKTKNIPLVFYTSVYKDESDEKLAMEVGANAFIRKPEDPKVIVEKINTVIKDHLSGKMMPPAPAITDEEEYLSKYSKTLFKKLEDKVLELEKANRKLEIALEELKNVDRLKDNIISNVTHELKTPLIHALGYLDLAMDENDAERRREFLKKCNNALNRENKVISNLIEISYSETGLLKPVVEEVDIGKLTKIAVEDMRPKAEAFDIDINLSVDDGLIIKGGASQLKHVLNNLLDNAVKFNKKGGNIEITAGKENGSVKICFKDTGIGIPSDKLEKIFSKIYQVDAESTRRYGGVGLGLALAKYFIELHKGKIWAESEAGKGSTFCFTIPAEGRQ